MRMLVLGAGLQGSACAYDLLQDRDVKEVRLADVHVGHLTEFLAPFSGPRLLPTALDVRDHAAVLGAMRQCDAVMSAIPYYFNYDMARLAVEAGVHFCDLGGNTEIVFKQKELDAYAKEKRVTVVPDCGLAPGMVNILARARHRAVRSRGLGEDLRRRAAAAAGAAAQLHDRLLARGRARLLHDALVGAAERQAHAGEGAVRA